MYWSSFKTFFKIGALTFGGRDAMIAIVESEIVECKQWLTKDDFENIIAIAQSCPGVFAINLSTYIGYKLKGVRGAICTAFATTLPAFFVILLVAMFFHHFRAYPLVEAIFKGVRPAVVALIAIPTWNMAKSARLSWTNCWIPIASTIAIWLLGVNPIFIILVAILGGFLYGKFIQPTEEDV